ncbi:MAG: LysE family translocator [Pseudomonadota bacterium]
MTLTTWLAVVSICALGAMSPGPSLAVVLRHTFAGGRTQGAIVALTHGLGVGLYALACISGLALLLTTSPRLFLAFQWAGAAYLAWLGLRALLSRASSPEAVQTATDGRGAAQDGFMIVFLNPKIAVFFIALFSQVIGTETSLPAKLGYAATAMVIDAGWYLLVAWLVSVPAWLPRLQAKAHWIERAFGVILLALAARLVWLTLV